MGSVWKRLNHINKRASKFRFTISYQELCLEAGPNWQPTALSIVWTRRGRRVVADPVKWEPTMKSPYVGMCVWPVPENKEILVTLFRDMRQEEYDNKDWFFILEDVKDNKRKPVAQGRLNLKDYASQVPTQHHLTIKLRPLTKKVTSCSLVATLNSEFLREGKPTEEDMRSVASLVSNSTIPNDIADLDTLREDVEIEAEEERLEQLKITNNELSALTESIQSLNHRLDRMSSERSSPIIIGVKGHTDVHHTEQPETSQGAASGGKITSTFAPPPAESAKSAQPRQSPPQQPEIGTVSSSRAPVAPAAHVATDNFAVKRPAVTSAASPSQSTPGLRPRPQAATPLVVAASQLSHHSTALQAKEAPKSKTENSKVDDNHSRPSVGAIPLSSDIGLDQKQVDVVASKENEIKAEEVRQPVASATTASASASNRDQTSTERKFTKTKSQELRDFMGEFVATSTLDFGPLSSYGETQQQVAAPSRPRQQHRGGATATADANNATPKKLPTPPVKKEENRDEAGASEPKLAPPAADTASAAASTPLADKRETPLQEISDNVPRTKIEIVPSDSFINSIANIQTSSSVSSSSEKSVVASPTDAQAAAASAKVSNTESPSQSTPAVSDRVGPNLLTKSKSEPPSEDAKENKVATKSALSQFSPNPVQQDLEVGKASGAGSDLLEWSRSILTAYPSLKVTNFTSSWRNGLAFCALIHNFYPELIPYDTLNPHDIKNNCKLAFESGEILGIPRVMEPENMVIRRIPDKLAVMTYLHQLRSALGTEETDELFANYKDSKNGGSDASRLSAGVRKSFSEGNIKFFASRISSIDVCEPRVNELPTVVEESSGSQANNNNHKDKYAIKAQELIAQARREESSESSDTESWRGSTSKGSPSPEKETNGVSEAGHTVIMRQKSGAGFAAKSRRDNRLSYIDNEMKVLDAEQQEIDRQAAILDKRIRETSEEDQMVYDVLLQQWFTLVNKKNNLIRRQMQLNLLEKEEDLNKKFYMLQDELRNYSEMDDERKTDEDREREDLLLQELLMVVKKRDELVTQRDEEERMIENDQQIDHDVSLPGEQLAARGKGKEECRMQ